MTKKSKEEINKNHDLEIEDLDNDDDLVTGGMDIKYDLLNKEEKSNDSKKDSDFNLDKMLEDICNLDVSKEEKKTKKEKKNKDDDDFFNKFVDDILGKDKSPEKKETLKSNSIGNLPNIRLGRRRRNRRSEESLDTQDVNEFLDEIARIEKKKNPKVEEKKEENKKENKGKGQKRDIYIQQQDQYFVDDEEVYLNELETDNCNWENIKNLFKVVTEVDNEAIQEQDVNRETVLNYFHDICKGLMNSRSEDFLSFVYSNPTVMEGLIQFGANEGVQKVLSSVLNLFESVNNLNSFRFLKHRFGLYRKLLRGILNCEDSDKINQLTKVFLQLVKEKTSIIDANYFIDKILLDPENHLAILDKVLRESNIYLAELASFIVKRVVPEEDRGFLEENSMQEIDKNFGKRRLRVN